VVILDKSDSRLHCEQIDKLMKAGRYNDAVYLVDKVDWRKEEDNKKLIQAAEAYRRTRRYDDAVNILKMAHNRRPNNKKIVYLLCETYFESKDVVTAQVYLDRYQSMTDKSDWHYDALKYKRALAYDLPVMEKIEILEELKKKEPAAEQFRFELAKLYNKGKQYAECAAECDELILLFGDDGKYARKALELKQGCVPLSDEQQALLRRLSLGATSSDKNSNDVKIMNTMDMSALNLESKLAEDIRTLKSEEGGKETRKKRPEFHTKSLEQTIPPSSQEVFFADKTEDISFTQYDVSVKKAGDIREVKAPVQKNAYNDPKEYRTGDNNEELSFSDDILKDDLDDDIPGQITMDDLLSDWSKIKERNTRNLRKSIHEDVVEQTGKIFEKKKSNEAAEEAELEEEPGSIWKEVAELDDEFAEEDISNASDDVAYAKENYSAIEDIKAAKDMSGEDHISGEAAISETNEEETIEEFKAGAENEANGISEEIETDDDIETNEMNDDIEANEMNDDIEADEDTGINDSEHQDSIPLTEEDTDETEARFEDTPASQGTDTENGSQKEVDPSQKEADKSNDELSEDEENKVKDLSPEERKLFSQFLHPRSMRIQIANALENISLAAYVGNVIITTDNAETGFALAKSIVKFVKFADVNFSGAMAKLNAAEFNNKKVDEILTRLTNGALVIEDANRLSNNALIRLTQGINQEERGILIFLIDTRAEIKKLVSRQRTITDYFNIKIDVIAMSESALVDYGMKYANNLGYSIDEGFANMAFHKRVREAQAGNHTVTIAEVKGIVDEAIEYNNRKSVSNLFRKMSKNYHDENGMIMLREKDFN